MQDGSSSRESTEDIEMRNASPPAPPTSTRQDPPAKKPTPSFMKPTTASSQKLIKQLSQYVKRGRRTNEERTANPLPIPYVPNLLDGSRDYGKLSSADLLKHGPSRGWVASKHGGRNRPEVLSSGFESPNHCGTIHFLDSKYPRPRGTSSRKLSRRKWDTVVQDSRLYLTQCAGMLTLSHSSRDQRESKHYFHFMKRKVVPALL